MLYDFGRPMKQFFIHSGLIGLHKYSYAHIRGKDGLEYIYVTGGTDEADDKDEKAKIVTARSTNIYMLPPDRSRSEF